VKLFGRELVGFPKAIVVLVAVLLVASGLCGLSGAIEARHGWSWFGPGLPKTTLANVLIVIDLASFVGILLSGAGLVFVLIAWPTNVVYRIIAKPQKDRVQRLLDQSDDTNHGGER
jgi:hypothetical protein